jgi:hypothetical protein
MIRFRIVPLLLFLAFLAACGEDKAPKPKTDAGTDSHPVKNVESLPSGNIQEGAKTMNKAADMGGSLEQQKQERDKGIEAQGR